MQLGLRMMPPVMSLWAHQLQSQLQMEGQVTVLFHHTVINQEGKELILVRGPIFQILEVKKQVFTLRVRTGIIALNEEELLILITVQENRNSLMTIELRLTLLLMRSFWKAVKIKS